MASTSAQSRFMISMDRTRPERSARFVLLASKVERPVTLFAFIRTALDALWNA
jgi:hypothetical protein